MSACFSEQYGVAVCFRGIKSPFHYYGSQPVNLHGDKFFVLFIFDNKIDSPIFMSTNSSFKNVDFFSKFLIIHTRNNKRLYSLNFSESELQLKEISPYCTNYEMKNQRLIVGNKSNISIFDKNLDFLEIVNTIFPIQYFTSIEYDNILYFTFMRFNGFIDFNFVTKKEIDINQILNNFQYDFLKVVPRKFQTHCFVLDNSVSFDSSSPLIYKFPENQKLKHLYIKILEKYKCYPQNVNKEQNFSAYIEEMEKKFLCKLDYNMVCNYFIDLMNSTKNVFDHVEDQNTLREHAKEFIFYFELIEKVIDDKTLLDYYEKLLRYSKNLDEITLLLKEFLVNQNNFETDLLFEFFKKINFILKEDSIKYYKELKYFLIENPLLKILRKYSFGTVKKKFYFFLLHLKLIDSNFFFYLYYFSLKKE